MTFELYWQLKTYAFFLAAGVSLGMWLMCLIMKKDKKSNDNYFKSTPMTDDMINDMIAGLSEQKKVEFLQKIFGKDWQEHYQGK